MTRVWPWLVLGLVLGLWPREADAQACSYSVSEFVEFGRVRGLPTPQIDVAATFSVTCSSLLSVNRRVCLSLPAGTGGLSIADRRMAQGSHFVQYQLYTNPGRTTVWGELGGSSPPRAVDFPLLIGTRTVDVPIYGRVFAGQTGKAVGGYSSNLTPQARWQNYVLTAPSCQSVTSSLFTLSTMTARLIIDPDCTITANPLDFGTVTAITGHEATTNLSATCTLNAAYTITLDGGSVAGDVNDRQMRLGPGPATVDYQLYRDSSRTEVWGDTVGTGANGTGSGSPQSIPVFGLVPAQGPKAPGVYQDIITATITF